MNALGYLITLCVGWGFLLGYLVGRANGRDQVRSELQKRPGGHLPGIIHR